MRRLWIGFIPYIVLSVVHVAVLAAPEGSPFEAWDEPTKLTLMPLLILAVLWGVAGTRWTSSHTLLVAALVLSWLGDGAGTFVPWFDRVPMMLLFFGLAHLCYIWLFWKRLAVRRVPLWAAVYVVWWIVLLAILWPWLEGLSVAVAAYGLVLGGTAVAATRCHPLITWGSVFFLASDSVLAFRLFMSDVMPHWTSPVVMLTYCLGQGLIAAGAVVALRRRAAEQRPVEVATV
jgi:uncharacterized membrane protein YhhN